MQARAELSGHPESDLVAIESSDFSVILFVNAQCKADKFGEKFWALRFPEIYKRWVVEVDPSHPVCVHFGILEAPTLVVSHRGMMLAVVDECEQAACDWLVEFAQQQKQRLE